VPASNPYKFNATVDAVRALSGHVRQDVFASRLGDARAVHLQFAATKAVTPKKPTWSRSSKSNSRACRRFAPSRRMEGARRAEDPPGGRAAVIVRGAGRASGAGQGIGRPCEKAGDSRRDLVLNAKDSIPGSIPFGRRRGNVFARERETRSVGQADLGAHRTETGGMTTHFWAVRRSGSPPIQITSRPRRWGAITPLRHPCSETQ